MSPRPTRNPGADLRASGKFLRYQDELILVKGVSYGTFAPDANGDQFPSRERTASDFRAIASLGANTVRCYTPPPLSLLDEAAANGLRTIVGIPWPQHTAFLETRHVEREIRASVRNHVRRLASHPGTLLFSLGNEIPPTVVRWYGRRRIEQFLRDLYDEAKDAAPSALTTYVNYPPTEYLETPFFDVCSFNVFLHDEDRLASYLARLQHLAFSRPLLVAEVGADSRRNGIDHQAELVAMQLRVAFRSGACGAVVFSWTDDWWRGGRQVDDWAFGLVDAERRPKPAFEAARRVFVSAPFSEEERLKWPRVSVAICAYNAGSTLDECLTSVEALHYNDFEIVLVNDGSTDDTAAIAARHPTVKVVTIPNGGLAAARNVAMEVATGEIVAYTDADVRVDPEWLTYLVQPFLTSDVVAAGGPNIVPPDDPWLAQAVARAPGGPTHVLFDDRSAEHIPGCNCAFRRETLVALGGFNPTFVRAGDDVDLCWRILDRGWKIGFSPSALVWHRHRPGVRAYLRQQVGYGEGERWLTREHPDKFVGGRATWKGFIYSPLPFLRSLSADRVNAGPFGSAPFPSVYRVDAHPFAHMPHSGRWQVAWITFLLLAALAAFRETWHAPVFLAAGAVTLIATLIKCAVYGLRSDLAGLQPIGGLSPRASRSVYHATIAGLHFLQPFARLYGRLRGLFTRTTPRAHVTRPETSRSWFTVSGLAEAVKLMLGGKLARLFWTKSWIDPGDALHSVADRLRRQRGVRHIEIDSGWWEDRDVTIVDRALFRFDMRVLVEDHGDAGCLYRFSVRSRFSGESALWLLVIPAAAALLYAADDVSWPVGLVLSSLIAVAVALTQGAVSWHLIADAIEAVAADYGLSPLPTQRPKQPQPADAPVQAHEPAGSSVAAADGRDR